MGRKSYETLAKEAGMSLEAYKAHLADKKANPGAVAATLSRQPDPAVKRERPAPVDSGDDDDAAREKADREGPDLSKIVLVDKQGCWGIIYGNERQSYVTLVQRNYYAEQTQARGNRHGEGKVYEAGSYGPWRLTEARYPVNDARAVELVADYLYRDGLQNEAVELRQLTQHMRDTWNKIRTELMGDIKMRSMYTPSVKS